jgi:hypothetical protein
MSKEFPPYGVMVREMGEKWEQIVQTDKEAIANNTLVGRYLTHGFADGMAVYQVTKINKKSVRIEVVTGIGDDWILPAWGVKTTLDFDTLGRFIDL